MANWDILKSAIADIIKTNGNQEITGQLLQNILNNIVSSVGENATFAGIATPETNPGAPDGPAFYLATKIGNYANFNGITLVDGEALILHWNNGVWSKKTTGFAVQEKVTEVEAEISSASYRKTFLNYANLNGTIQSSGNWGGTNSDSYKHCVISVSPGDRIVMKADKGFYFRWFSRYVGAVNGEAPFAVGDIQGLSANAAYSFVVPDNASYFVVSVLDAGNRINYSQFTINGYDLLTDLQSKLNGKMNTDNDLYASIDNSLTSVLTNFHRYNGTIQSSGKWAGVDDSWNFVLLRVKGGDKVQLKSDTTFLFYFLSDFEYPVNNKEVQHTIGDIKGYNSVNGETTYSVPSGAKYMPIAVKVNGVECMPTILSINGYDLLTDLQSKLNGKADSNVYSKYDNCSSINFADFNLQKGVIVSSGKWNTNTSCAHTVVKVKEGDKVNITSGHTYYFYFLSEYPHPVNNELPSGIIGEIQGCQAGVNKNFTIPAGASYMIIQIINNGITAYPTRLTLNGFDLLSSIGQQIAALQSEVIEEKIITVNGAGGEDFISLREAIEYCYPNRPNTSSAKSKIRYLIKIFPGTYNIRSYYTEDEWNADGFTGLTLPRDCKLLGVGRKRGDVVITCTSEVAKSQISTLNVEDNVEMENLTVYGNNIRYVIHDDYSYYPYANKWGSYRRIKNVDFIGENLTYQTVYGAGTKGGAKWEFDNCNFINKSTGACFSVHDRDGYIENALPESFHFNSCEFIGQNKFSVRFLPLTSASEQSVVMHSCSFSGIKIQSEAHTTSHYNIVGSGNTKDFNLILEGDMAQESIPRFADIALIRKNVSGKLLIKGTRIKLNDDKQFIEGTDSDYAGIVMKDIAVDDFGIAYI